MLTTKELLQQASTPEQLQAAVTLAKSRGWTDPQIARHAKRLAVLQAPATPAQPKPKAAPKPPRWTTESAPLVKPIRVQVTVDGPVVKGTAMLSLLREVVTTRADGKEFTGLKGLLMIGGEGHPVRLTEAAVDRLESKGTKVWVGGRAHKVVKQ